MMRVFWATVAAIAISAAPLVAQQRRPAPPSYAQQPQRGSAPSAQTQPAERVASQQRQSAVTSQPAPNSQSAASDLMPFPPLAADEQAALQRFLLVWQQHSQATKTLECKFSRWEFDNLAAPPGIHVRKAEGVVKYAAPDKGLFRVDRLLFLVGMEGNKGKYQEQPGKFGEHWVCNGKQLIEMDRSQKQCRIQELPPEMQGQRIFNSPLPFVFNLNAAEIQQRYWVRLGDAGKPGAVLVEAFPKRKEDRAQYKLVQIALDTTTFLPIALLIYPPNFDPKQAPSWDHYEFADMKRNAIGAGFQTFLGYFIPERPPATWKILHDKFPPAVDPPVAQAATQPVNPPQSR